MAFDHLILMLTDTCPLQCAHCCVESGPHRQTTMALEDALSYVRQAHALNPNTFLSFTGGEPFVRYPLLRAVAAEAHRLGIWHTVCTSAVWCKSKAFAYERLSELKDLGLRTLSISYDAFHNPWTTPEHVRACAEAGVDLGLRVAVGGAVTKSSPGTQQLLGSWCGSVPEVQVIDSPVAPNGRATLIPVDDLLIKDWGGRNELCPYATEIYIQPDGSAYPCCTTGGDFDFLRIGNARQMSLADLRRRLEQARWFRTITEGGFGALEDLVRLYHPEIEFPRAYVNVCHLCNLVFGAGELSAVVRDALNRHERAEMQITQGIWESLRLAVAGASPSPSGDGS